MMAIAGAALGAFVLGNSMTTLKKSWAGVVRVFKGNRWKEADFRDLLALLYTLLATFRKGGANAIEPHLDAPAESPIFSRYPSLLKDHELVEFICDYLRMMPEAALRVMAEEMRVELEPPLDSDQGKQNIDVRPSREGMRIHLIDSPQRSMFKGSTAQLNDFAKAMLARAAHKLAGIDARIAIEGHTDGSGGDSEANWILSAQRALAARSAMVAAGLPADHFSEVVAKAGTEPVYPEAPDRPENRRITIVVMAQAGALPRDASFKF